MQKEQHKTSEIIRIMKRIPIFILAHCVKYHYNKKYYSGSKFQGKLGGLNSSGWMWLWYDWRGCRKLHVNLDCPWPVSPRATVLYPQNIEFDPDDLNNFQSPGTYFQGNGKITIGKGTFIGPNVGIITSNHMIENLKQHDEPRPVTIGKNCWIGMNSVILPGVVLGDSVIVGAGSVVTKSFEDGNCIIAGSPAKIIKTITIDGKE